MIDIIPISVVLITNNENDIIEGCIQNARLITDDVIVIINDNSDETFEPARSAGYRLYKKSWDGYGANKNKGIEVAKYNWILSIDADEVPDRELIKSLHGLTLDDPEVVYDIKFRSYFGRKAVRFGSWGRDHHIRLFNRNLVRWSETIVHETLMLPETIKIKKLSGRIHHYSVKDLGEYDRKNSYYAKLSAKKYFSAGRRSNAVKLYFSPVFGFIKNYLFYLGFLDGREGWDIAITNSKNTYRKYYYLWQIENQRDKKQPVNDNFAVEY